MQDYESPQIEELGSVAAFTGGQRFAWQLDGATLSEIVQNVVDGGHILGTS